MNHIARKRLATRCYHSVAKVVIFGILLSMKKNIPLVAALFALSVAFTFPCFPQDQEAQMRFRLGQSLEQAGDFERASKLYEDLMKSDSLNYVYFDALRRCYEQLKSYNAAIDLSLRRLARQPNDLNALATLGGIYYRSGDEAHADSVWNSIITLLPSSFASYQIVASAQSENRLFDKSIATYLRGRKQIGDPLLFVGELAALYSLLLNYPEATREYITMLLHNEQQLEFIESRFTTFTSKREGLVAATKATEEAVAREGKSVVLRRLLSWLYMEGKKFENAFTLAKELEATVNSGGAEIMMFADRAFREKAYKVAAAAYKYDIDLYPSMPQIPLAKFGYARAMEEQSGAIDTVSGGGKTSIEFPLEAQPGLRGAIVMFLSLAKEYPYSEISVQSLYRVGVIRYERFFDLDGALLTLDSVLTIPAAKPMTPVIQAEMGEIYVARGELSKASQRYAGVLASQYSAAAQKSQAQFRLAEIQYFQNNFDSAATLLEQLTLSLSADESNDALLLLHFIKENQTEYSDALKLYAKAILLKREKKLSESLNTITSDVQTFSEAPLADDALIINADLCTRLNQHQDALSAYRTLLSDYPLSILRDRAQFGIGELYQEHLNDKEKAIQAYEELLASYPHSLLLEETRKRIRILRGDAI